MTTTLHLSTEESIRIRDLLAEAYEMNLEYQKDKNIVLGAKGVQAIQEVNAIYRRSYEILISQGIPRIPLHPINQH